MSTLMVGAPEPLLDASRVLFAAAAKRPEHVTMHATLSRGCPGEPDDPSCHYDELDRSDEVPLATRQAFATEAIGKAPVLGVKVDHMDEIWGCIEFLKSSGTFHKAKNFCTRLRGDAGPVFETLRQAFIRFGPGEGHVTIDMTTSANSPSLG